MASFDCLTEYENRQVVLNTYEGDELLERDGVRFERIEVLPERIVFLRQERMIKEVPITAASRLTLLSGFPRYYAIEGDCIRVELYFP